MSNVGRALGVKAFAYVEMARPYTLFHAGTVALAAALVASDGRVSVARACLIWLTPTVGWLAGLVTSDYHDRHLDRVEKPHRPIPSGRVAEREAFWLMVSLIAAGFVGALLLGWQTFLLAWLVMALGIAYARTFKAKGILGHADRGVLAALTVVFGSIAATGGVPAQVWPLVVLYFLHDSATNLLGAIRDVAGDRAAGYQTAPVRHGVTASLVAAGTLIALWATIGGWYAMVRPAPLLYPVLLIAALLLDGAALALIARAPAADEGAVASTAAPSAARVAALAAHKVLVVERLVLSVAFIATVIPPVGALAILAALALVSWWAQVSLRDRYEFASEGSDHPVGKEEDRHGHAGASARTA